MTRCEHWQAKRCALKDGRTVSMGVCRGCKQNTAPESWPPTLLERAALGDKAEALLGLVPGVKRLPCYGEDGRLKPESGCGKRKAGWNGKRAGNGGHGQARTATAGEAP